MNNFVLKKEDEKTLLHTALQRNDPSWIVRQLIKQEDLASKDIFGNTPLHIAFSEKSSPEVVKLLVKQKFLCVKNL